MTETETRSLFENLEKYLNILESIDKTMIIIENLKFKIISYIRNFEILFSNKNNDCYKITLYNDFIYYRNNLIPVREKSLYDLFFNHSSEKRQKELVILVQREILRLS